MYMQELIEKVKTYTNTDTRAERVENMERYASNESDCGGNGKAFEIACASVFSARTTYAKQGQTDRTMQYNGARVSVEVKSNGGRIDNILQSDFVLYGFDICNSTTKGKRRACDIIFCPSAVFLDALEKCGAVKDIYHAHKVDGRAIQPSKKAFYEWLTNYPVIVKDWTPKNGLVIGER